MEDPIPLLQSLVAIPSVNPMGGPADGPIYFETALSGFIEQWLHERDIAVTRMPVSPGRDNLIARYRSDGSRRTIVFDAHQDTVPVTGMTIPPFEPTISGDRLQGRGSCDIKSGLAAMLVAFAGLCRDRPRDSANVILACTVDEEFTHTGSSKLAESLPPPDLTIVAEPTGLDIVTCHKGAIRWKLSVHGRACHSSTPRLGDNAIYRMAKTLQVIEEYARMLMTERIDPMLGPATLSVGRISGGLSVNVVPDHCEIEIDRRLLPGESAPRRCSHASPRSKRTRPR